MAEITSSILKLDEFKRTAETLLDAAEVDNEVDFREHVIEYINDTSDTNDDMFFFDMLPFTRFLVPHKGDNDSHIAYTDENELIYLNCPSEKVGKDIKVWEFIYDHECLHQLWDTFGVADELKKNGIEVNHYILNIASDCVINDYLRRIRRKKPFTDGIFPEFLEEKYGVEYNPKLDTQYSLYLKLIEVKDKLEKDEDMKRKVDNNEGPQGDGDDNSNGNGDNDNNSSGKSGKQSDDKNGNDGGNGKDDKDDKDEKGKDGKDGNNGRNGKDEKDGKDGKGKDGKDESGNKEGSQEKGKGGEKGNETKNEKGAKTWGRGNGSNPDFKEENIKEIRNKIKKIKEKYKNKISGDLGNFIEKCKSSASVENNGLMVETNSKGVSSWDKDMKKVISGYVKHQIFLKNRQYEPTFKRPRRGYAVKSGDVMKPDRRIKNDKFMINFAFYIDKSGSMAGIIDNVFEAAYTLCESINKDYGRDKVVSGTEFKMYAFDDYIYEIKYGKKCEASAGNMDFGELCEKIVELTNDYLVNVIITDAQFDVNEKKTNEFLKKLKGILVFIVNSPSPDFKDLAKKSQNKMYYIEADSEFRLHNKK